MDTFDLALILTAAGATVSAALIAAVTQIAKRVPAFGTWLDAGKEATFALLLSFLLVGYAFVATTPTPDLFNGFAAFLAWVGVAGLATKAYDVAPAGLKTTLGGGGG